MSPIIQVKSDRGMWVFTFVPEGDVVEVWDKEVGIKPLNKPYDAVQGHIVNGDQFMPDTPVDRFLADTEGMTTYALKKYFYTPKDGISLETLAIVRAWLKDPDKGHKVTGV